MEAEAGSHHAQPQTDVETTDTGAEVLDSGWADRGHQTLDSGARLPDVQPQDSAGSTVTGDGGSCIEVMQCVLGCSDDEACERQCMDQVLPRNREVTEAVVACAKRHNCADPTCIMRQCPNEASACGDDVGEEPEPVGDVGMPAGESYSCADMIRCVNACGPDTRCFSDCLERVRPESMNLAAGLTRCMMNARCIDMDCGYRSCPDESARCLADD